MVYDIRSIRDDAKKDFRKAWIDTAKLIPESSSTSFIGGKGKPHPIHDLVATVRKAFLTMGFDEVENQMFISEEDVYKQYGPEAPVILDRCYYLAGLPRPDIGLGDEKITEISGIAEVNIGAFKHILREYREGVVEGDDMIETMVNRLKIQTEEATQILDLFPEFKNIEPKAGKTTLRSHMTGAWFPTLSAIQDIAPMPVKLFSVGMRYRREQKVDSSHLRAHYGGSCVIMDEDMSLEVGKELTEKILNELDFGDIRFELKKATSNYYAPKTEYEVFSGDIEVADIGMYSPVALANYDIKYNVFNLGFGMERVLMVKHDIGDVREVLYPQFYSKIELSDKEVADQIAVELSPKTKEGIALSEAICKTALENDDASSPCEFKAFEGKIAGKNVVVSVVEKEGDTQLLGPAALNDVYVFDGGVYALPKDTSKLKASMSEVKAKGIKTNVSMIKAVADYAAYKIEEEIADGKDCGLVQFKMAKTPADVNIAVGGKARRFIQSNNKQISVKGPVFTSIEYKISI